jgi:hypothetical protein
MIYKSRRVGVVWLMSTKVSPVNQVTGGSNERTAGASARFRHVMEDIRLGRHREAYTLFVVGVVLTVLGLSGVVGTKYMLSAILAALTFLVFETAAASGGGTRPLEQVLRTREDFGAFAKILPGVRDLWIYGPTAVSVLTNAADIRRFVLRAGGKVRVLTLAEDQRALDLAAIQLDDNLDLAQTLRNSLATAAKFGAEPGFSHRQLFVNPGFSLIIVNPYDPKGYVIYECHGFKDDNIADRMHITISKADSPRWFNYWIERYEAMWEAAQPPVPPPDEARAIQGRA